MSAHIDQITPKLLFFFFIQQKSYLTVMMITVIIIINNNVVMCRRIGCFLRAVVRLIVILRIYLYIFFYTEQQNDLRCYAMIETTKMSPATITVIGEGVYVRTIHAVSDFAASFSFQHLKFCNVLYNIMY